ncbi:MAG: putative membrane protein [Candidatus Gottesmanbacteria bacterium GW2011_GWA1_44_24b]|uniref:Putative membrane protein n=1 Tax=Candidatus Gottesmanbacteria bacterium GW2011_GWA1_44_24b TaxID=1618437 RepID=A0A0G1IIE8_9BACT|nr:MAG: putative membrane protein [Candidatus Gottesmanbacteria bacterium GW2011_GWA1_44_24b]
MPNLIVIFLTGLLTGGITCAAVQGGLLMAVLANADATNPVNLANPTNKIRLRMITIVFVFVLAKLISHTILGFFLGFMGEKLQFSVQFTAIMLGIASVFMIGMGLNMLSVHPVFRRFAVTTPKFFRTLVWKQSKRTDFLAPVILGALTIFIPCGTTQAMMAQAIASGQPITGALILFSFILGTAPLFILLGLAITTLTQTYKQWFEKVAAIIIIGMAVWNLYNASTIFGVDRFVKQFIQPIACQIVYCDSSIDSGNLKSDQRQTTKTPIITVRQTEYEVDNPYIRSGDEIRLTVVNKDGYGCIQYFRAFVYVQYGDV